MGREAVAAVSVVGANDVQPMGCSSWRVALSEDAVGLLCRAIRARVVGRRRHITVGKRAIDSLGDSLGAAFNVLAR